MTEITITPFDNEISILHKWSSYFKVPVRLVIINTVVQEGREVNVYSSGVTTIRELMDQGNTLRQIYKALSDKLETPDIVMTYVLTSMVKEQKLEELLPHINKLYIDIGDETIEEVNELELLLEYWRGKFDTDYQYDLENLAELEDVHQQLEELDNTADPNHPKVLFSPIKVDKVTIKAHPILKSTNVPPTVDDALIMFNDSKPSYDIPYIRYNSEGGEKSRQELFKLYQGRTDEEMPDFKIIIPHTSQTNKDDSFYMTVWSGKGTKGKATKESYMKGYYNIPTNTLTIKTPTDENVIQTAIVEKIEETLPISINNLTETAISGEFFLFNLEINYIYLVDMIINTDLMSSYLFVKENTTSYAEKTQLKIYYKSFTGFEEEEEENVSGSYIVIPSSVTVSLKQDVARGGEIVNVMMPEGVTKFRLPPGLPYVKAKITQAESLELANQFVKIFTLLMQYYVKEKTALERLFLSYIPELNQQIDGAKPLEITVKATKNRKKTGDSKIERLKEVGPDLFVNGYARKCQCIFQPIAIPPDEIESWKNKTFLYKEVERQRQVMSFPPDNPKWNFVCPNDSAAFPGVKMNKDLSNKDIYPCVPCCFKDDQMDPKVFSNYNECFRGKTKKEEEKAQVKETHKIKTDKIISPGRFGYVPKAISDLVSKYSPTAVDIARTGVPYTVNSLLHCVSIAIRDPTYLGLKTDEQKEAYVTNIRSIIAAQTIPSLLRQEMYDFTDEEIMEQLKDPAIFLDPNLFYRAVEQSYNINIYVFSPPSKDDSSSLGIFDVPRFKLFHARSPRPEKTAVLIFRTMGAEADSLTHPQCELIVDQDQEKGRVVYSFGSNTNINSLLHDALSTMNRTITWGLVSSDDPNYPKQIVARDNIYSRQNYHVLLNKLPTAQIVDGYGKTRGFIMDIGEQKMTVIVPSTQPENLPTRTVTRIDYNIPVAIFGEPSAVTKQQDGLVDGFWYEVLDLEYGIYIPVNLTEEYTNVKTGPNNPLVEEGQNVVQRVRKLKRDLDTILQIVKWLYLVSGLDVASFINKYVSYGQTETGDSATVYDLSRVEIKLPRVDTVEKGIEIMSQSAPTLFRQNRIYLYSAKFFNGVLYYLQKYDHERKPREIVIPTVIYREDISEEDFKPQRRVAIFTNEENMRTWLDTLDKLSFRNIIIENELNISNALRLEPYLYYSPTKNIYLIQNVSGGDRRRAINVAFNWYLYKVNIGHDTPEYDQDLPVYVVYGISPALAPILIENNAGESMQYLQILSYGSNQYAAMLPLL